MRNLLKNKGYTLVSDSANADMTIINSCTVTSSAASKTRSRITAAKKANPEVKIALVGCYAQEAKENILDKKEVDLILGNEEKYNIDNYIPLLKEEPIVSVQQDGANSTAYTFLNHSSPADGKRTRANLKIQEGCDYYCSYCIIPHLRGDVRSKEYETSLKEAKKLDQIGYNEIVLTGVNTGRFHSKDKNLVDLIQGILTETALKRIRISSIEPNLVEDRLIRLMKDNDRLCNFLHIPLQHGTNQILERMNRNYTIGEYTKLVKYLKSEIPEICIGTDLMVGFPGESKELFLQMKEKLSKLPINHYHVFRFSPKKGTPAEEMADKVHSRTKKKRSKQLRELGKKKKQEYISRFKDQHKKVLVERVDDGRATGYTDNFIRVNFRTNKNLKNKIVSTKIIEIEAQQALGDLKNQ